MAITKSKRTEFTGVHLDPATKKTMRDKARREKKSVSAFIAEAVDEKLERAAIVEAEAEDLEIEAKELDK